MLSLDPRRFEGVETLHHRSKIRMNIVATALLLPTFGSMNVWTTNAKAQAPAAAPVINANPSTVAATVPAASVTPTTYVASVPAQPARQPVQQQIAVAAAGDPYGFTNWLNATRAQYGLRAVGFDPNLAAWCNSNNAQQASRGMGHHVMGPARRQNCAMGAYANIGAMWLSSPAHRAALLDPSISWIGIAGWGTYWTFNAY